MSDEYDINASRLHMDFFRRCEDERYILMQGGRRSGKTWSILQFLLMRSLQRRGTRVLIVTDTFARLTNSLFTDIEDICGGLGKLTKGSNPRYQLPNGSRWDFVCANRNVKGYSSSYDFLFFNEAWQYDWSVARDLLKACGDDCRIFVDYNPYMRFWANERWENGRNKLVTTYHDNKFLPATTRQLLQEQEDAGRDAKHGTMERYLYEVECLGVDSALSGLCFPSSDIITAAQYETVRAPEFLGIDWGIVKNVGDPDAVVAVKVVDDDIYIREVYCSNSGTDGDIAYAINRWRERCVDGRPIAFYEYASFGEERIRSVITAGARRDIDYRKAVKHQVMTDLINMSRITLHITEESVNVRLEQQNYKYVESHGQLVAGDRYNHAMDAMRYAWNGYNEWRYRNGGLS